MDYQSVINVIGEYMQYCLPLSIILGLIERLMDMVVKAATGRGDK